MRATLVAVVLLCLPPATAAADDGNGIMAGTAEGGPPRTGWMYGANIGRGRLDIGCPGCGDLAPLEDGLSIGGHVGTMLSPRLAVMVDVWSVRYSGRDNYWFDDSRDHVVEQRVITGAAQMWVSRRWWLRAGLGGGHHNSDARYTEAPGGALAAAGDGQPRPPSRFALATALAAGLEVIHTRDLAIDLVLRTALSRGEGIDASTSAVELGVSWY